MIVTRFAPSPTGRLHCGNYRTAVFAYLFARNQGGKFILRIEDTDRARFSQEYQDDILDSLSWLGLEHDELYIQSERASRHRELMQKLIDEQKAYISEEAAKDGSGIIKQIVRFRNPGEVVTFHDEIRGNISIDTTDLGDFVIGRSIDEPLYHFAVVADDVDMGITHVVRGDDHIANTPRQVLISRALGAPDFRYAHLPLVFGPDKQKLSKRRGAKSVTQYREEGYVAGAIFNFMMSLGWNEGEGAEQEIYTKDELISKFSLDRIQKSPAVFNSDKLDWFNREYIKTMSLEEQLLEVQKRLSNVFSGKDHGVIVTEDVLRRALPTIMERVTKWGDIDTMIETGDIQYYFADPEIAVDVLPGKNNTLDVALSNLDRMEFLLEHQDDWSVEGLKDSLMPVATELGRAQTLWPLRFALTGKEKSPDPFTMLSILGKDVSLRRIYKVLESNK